MGGRGAHIYTSNVLLQKKKKLGGGGCCLKTSIAGDRSRGGLLLLAFPTPAVSFLGTLPWRTVFSACLQFFFFLTVIYYYYFLFPEVYGSPPHLAFCGCFSRFFLFSGISFFFLSFTFLISGAKSGCVTSWTLGEGAMHARGPRFRTPG